MLIQKTTDYEQFKGVVGNRKIHKPHVDELIASIEKKNLLQFHPINVTKDMRVIDGQHRLQAAKALSLPIFYIEMEKGDIEDIRLLQIQRSWSKQNYLDSYIDQNFPEYIALEEFIKTYGLSLTQGVMIGELNFGAPHAVNKIFMRGEFRFVDKNKSELFAGYLNELKKYCTDNAWKDRDFLVALSRVMDKISIKQLFYKLETFSLAITKRISSRDYMRELEDIYNFRQHAESHVRLA